MGSTSRHSSRTGIRQAEPIANHQPTSTSGAENSGYNTVHPSTNYGQGACTYGDPFSYSHDQPVPSPPPSYMSPSSALWYPVPYPELFTRVSMTSGPIDLVATMNPMAGDQHCGVIVSDLHSVPYAPPATPTSTATGSNSPISPRSPLAIPDSPELSNTNAASAPTRSEERARARHRSGSRSSTEGRGCFYRTKPCRFFHGGSGFCIKGDRCNFIHDYAAGRDRANTDDGIAEKFANAENDENRPPHRTSKTPTERKRSNKKSSLNTENNSRNNNFYPITWRVIGGGVPMSGSREVCQAYLAGHCSDGLDCRFSHPSAIDELEGSVTGTPSPAGYHVPFFDHWSPLYINPFAAPHMAPPSPITEDGYDDAPAQTLTIDTLAARPVKEYFPTRVILDGDTLLPRDSAPEEDAPSPLYSRPPSPEPPSADECYGTRTIPRPVSTPPYSTSSFAKVVRLFAAEMP